MFYTSMTRRNGLMEAVHEVMSRNYAITPVDGGFKIDSWLFFRNMAALDDQIREALAKFKGGGK